MPIWGRLKKNVLRRTRADEFIEHLAAVMLRILDLTVKLAVRKGTRAAFAKLHVRFRIEHRLAPQPESILGALAHGLAALENDRTEAHLREDQPGKQAARPHTDHDRARGSHLRRRLGDKTVRHIRGHTAVRHIGEPLERGRFILHLDVDDVSELDVGALARVMRATKHGVSDEPVLAHAEFSEARADGGFENALGMVEREFDFA